jgi:hypothetical protein
VTRKLDELGIRVVRGKVAHIEPGARVYYEPLTAVISENAASAARCDDDATAAHPTDSAVIQCDLVIWAAGARAIDLFCGRRTAGTGSDVAGGNNACCPFVLDDRGFIAVDQMLQVQMAAAADHMSHTSHATSADTPEQHKQRRCWVFAAGDCASLPSARPKAGVFAVRQVVLSVSSKLHVVAQQSLTLGFLPMHCSGTGFGEKHYEYH